MAAATRRASSHVLQASSLYVKEADWLRKFTGRMRSLEALIEQKFDSLKGHSGLRGPDVIRTESPPENLLVAALKVFFTFFFRTSHGGWTCFCVIIKNPASNVFERRSASRGAA